MRPSASPSGDQSFLSRPRLSVMLITLDSERLLERVLESVRWADEIVIVDSGSTDRTAEIARRYTEHFQVRDWRGFGIQKQRALDLCTGEWVLSIDSDEVVSPELRASVERAIRAPGAHVAFRMKLATCFGGVWFGSRGWRADRKLRLFRRDLGRFSTHIVHEGVEIDGSVGWLEGLLLHYSYRDIEHFASKMNHYSSSMATRKLQSGARVGAVGAVLRGIARFWRDWLFGGDFLYGGAGLTRSALSGYYTFLTYAKLWEQARGGSDCLDETAAGASFIS
jgi:glycosyltransferase involved in cell wall biosynthesis